MQYLAQLGSDETSSTLNTEVSDINEEIASVHASHAEHSIADKDNDTSSAGMYLNKTHIYITFYKTSFTVIE